MARVGEPDRHQQLFESPTVKALQSLAANEFNAFVQYVFRRAGYEVVVPTFKFGRGADFELVRPGDRRLPHAAVMVHSAEAGSVISTQMVKALKDKAIIRKHGASGYLITAGNVEHAARSAAGIAQRIRLLDCDQFCRYIRYVRGSRFDESTGITVLIPPDMFAVGASAHDLASPTKILAIANNKGGVGKTTTARFMAKNLAEMGKRVLVVDMDPQGNLTEEFLSDDRSAQSHIGETPNLAHYFAGVRSLPELLQSTATPQLFIIPAHPDLSLLDTGGAGRPTTEIQFAWDLKQAFATSTSAGSPPFDWILLDTPPAVSLFTRAALCAAAYVIAPARSRPSSLAGIRNVMQTMDTMNALKGESTDLVGCLITHWDEDQHSQQTYARLEEQFENRRSRILASYIEFDPTVEKKHGPFSPKARSEYHELVREVLRHVERS